MPFAYQRYLVTPSPADPSTVIDRPALKVRVSGPVGEADEVAIWGLLDIGSVECILPHEYADRLRPAWCGTGILEDHASGSHPVEYGGVYLQIRTEKQRIRWPAIVAFSRQRTSTTLWGRIGFLDHFSVTFNGPKKYFILRLRTPAPAGFTVDRLLRRRRGSGGDRLIAPADQDP